MRAATRNGNAALQSSRISIHAAHAGSDNAPNKYTHPDRYISIHAAHAGSDKKPKPKTAELRISIHAAHAGSDFDMSTLKNKKMGFQSTLPMRAATVGSAISKLPQTYFNPRCPCGQRLQKLESARDALIISIHAAHAGSDKQSPPRNRKRPKFQSTLPMRAATPLPA